MILFTLPVPPSVNDAYRIKRGRRVPTQAHTDWKLHAQREVRRQSPETIRTPCILVVNVERGARTTREDVDNRLKLLQDSLKDGGAIEDDSLIVALAAAWAPPGTRTARLALLPSDPLTLEFHPAKQCAAAGGWIIPAAHFAEEAA
jgi:Holliday junction resolvase RusA-like endonuclease